MTDQERQDLEDRVRFGVAMMRTAFKQARSNASPNAELKFACVTIEPNGSGQVGATFEAEGFLNDIEALLPPLED